MPKSNELKINAYNLGIGDEAIFNTIKIMEYFVLLDKESAIVKNIVAEIEKSCNGDKELFVEKTFNYVVDNIKYVFDHENVLNYTTADKLANTPEMTEFLQRPFRLLDKSNKSVKPYGDCDDMAMAICAILLSAGFTVKMKVIAINGNDFQHVLCSVLLNNKSDGNDYWVGLDPVIGKFGQEVKIINREQEFEIKPTDVAVKPKCMDEGESLNGIGFLNYEHIENKCKPPHGCMMEQRKRGMGTVGAYGQDEFIAQWKKDIALAVKEGKANWATIGLEVATSKLSGEFSSPTLENILMKTITDNYTSICGDAAKDMSKSWLQENWKILFGVGVGIGGFMYLIYRK